MTERLNRMLNLTQFEVARHAASRDEIYAKLQESTEQLRETKMRLTALETLISDNQQLIASKPSPKFAKLRTQAESLKTQISQERSAYQAYLRTLAQGLLEERRQRLTSYITETYLGMERVENKNTALPSKASDKL